MKNPLIYGILYVELNDNLGPNPVMSYPTTIDFQKQMQVSIKVITLLSGEKGLVPKTLVILPFPALELKGLVKYIVWEDKERRGGIGQSALVLLFKEINDAIFYKFINDFEPIFDNIAQKIIKIEQFGREENYLLETLKNFEIELEELLEELKNRTLLKQKYSTEFPESATQAHEFPDFKFKVAIVGDPTVGKTSLVLRFTNNVFNRTYISTLGVHVSNKHFIVLNKNVQFVIWDIAGQAKFELMRRELYLGSDAVFFVFDLTNPESFLNISKWHHDVHKQLGSNRFFVEYLIGNKNDLKQERKIDNQKAVNLAGELGLSYFETSALTGKNVDQAFINCAKLLLEHEK
ncbi:MAG: Rab family GTPase [Promethearchaeota archaeon]